MSPSRSCRTKRSKKSSWNQRRVWPAVSWVTPVISRSTSLLLLGIEPAEQPARALGLFRAQDALCQHLHFGDRRPQHLLLHREQLRRMHRELPQAEAEQQ